MIKNGRPYTNENENGDGDVDDILVTRHNDADLQKIGEWIRKNIRRDRKIYKNTSVILKEKLEKDIGIYLTNNEFKDAMLLMGYKPVDPNQVFWKYRIALVKYENPSPFFQWVKKKNIADETSPEGYFARSILEEPENFPIFAEYDIIMRYLDNYKSCITRDAFKNLWELYEMEKNG